MTPAREQLTAEVCRPANTGLHDIAFGGITIMAYAILCLMLIAMI